MVDGINNMGGITPQSGKTVKKQEQLPKKDSTSIFNNNGNAKVDLNHVGKAAIMGGLSGIISGKVSGETAIKNTVTSQEWENGILEAEVTLETTVTVPYESDVNNKQEEK